MSLFLDLQYLQEISYRFEKFSKKENYLFNCRCWYCGDSKKDKNKARGFFYKHKDRLSYKCHNCDVGKSFANVLQEVDPEAYKRYRFAEYGQKKTDKKITAPLIIPALFNNEHEEKSLTDKFPFLVPLASLKRYGDIHEAWQYFNSRAIPQEYSHLFYYVEKSRHLNALSDKYTGKFKYDESRLILPMYMDGKLAGVLGRDLNPNSTLRYVILKLDDSFTDMVFGLDRINLAKPIRVTEGPIDSLFIRNCLAVNCLNLTRVEKYLPGIDPSTITLLFDNQPRHKEVLGAMEGAIAKGFKVCFWPSWIIQKDINDMIMKGGYTREELERVIDENSFAGLSAKAAFMIWRKKDE